MGLTASCQPKRIAPAQESEPEDAQEQRKKPWATLVCIYQPWLLALSKPAELILGSVHMPRIIESLEDHGSFWRKECSALLKVLW